MYEKPCKPRKQNISDYIVEELSLTPHPLNIDDFLKDIDTLRDDVARLQARINALEKKEA